MLAFPALLALSTPHVDPAHARNITVYHVNPHQSGAIPVNMDTGNAAGDLMFDLIEVLLTPLACQNASAPGFQCNNKEAVGQDLVVNKVTLEVDARYSACKPPARRLRHCSAPPLRGSLL